MPGGLVVAVPSIAPGGPDAAPNAHFGRCQFYTLARVEDGKIGEVNIQPNPMHQGGDCAGPVQALLRLGVGALLAGGHGHAAPAGFAGGWYSRVLQCQSAHSGRLS